MNLELNNNQKNNNCVFCAHCEIYVPVLYIRYEWCITFYTKMMKNSMEGPLDRKSGLHTSSQNVSCFRFITWKQLRQDYEFGTIADGYALKGMVVFKEEEFWNAGISKVFRVRDLESTEENVEWQVSLVRPQSEEGQEGSLPSPLTGEEEDFIQLGAIVAFYNPQPHKFVDGEEGLAIDTPDGLKILQQPKDVMLTAKQKLQIAHSIKEKGNKWMWKKEYHRALGNYTAAVSLLEGMILDLSRLPEGKSENGKEDGANSYLALARVLQSECGSNLMVIGIQKGEWKGVIQIGQEVLKNGAKDGIRCKVFYRMGLAFEKLGLMEMALDYAQRAKDIHCQEAGDACIEQLYQRAMLASRSQRQMREVEKELLRAHSIPGMHQKFGYRPPLLWSASNMKGLETLVLDLSTCFSPKTVLPSSAEKHDEEAERRKEPEGMSVVNGTDEGVQALRPHLLHLSVAGPLSITEERYISTVCRFKTLIYFHVSPLSPFYVSATPPPSLPFFSHLDFFFSWFLGKTYEPTASIPSEARFSLFDGAKSWIVAPSGTAGRAAFLPLPDSEQVIVSVDMAPFLFPSFLLFFWSILTLIGLYSVVWWLQRVYFRCCCWTGRWTFQKRLLQCLQDEREGREWRRGLLATTAHILSKPCNYPIAFCAESIIPTDDGNYEEVDVIEKLPLEEFEKRDILLPVLNNYFRMLFHEKNSDKRGDANDVKEFNDEVGNVESEVEKENQGTLFAMWNAQALLQDVKKASTFLLLSKQGEKKKN